MHRSRSRRATRRRRRRGRSVLGTCYGSRSDLALFCARQVPVLEWFVPPARIRPAPPPSQRVYTLRVWDVLEAPLYVFSYVAVLTRLYSPAHALWWAVAGSLGMHAFTTYALTAVLMAAFSCQTYFLALEYAALVRDRQVLSGEVLREYDEKVRRSSNAVCHAACHATRARRVDHDGFVGADM